MAQHEYLMIFILEFKTIIKVLLNLFILANFNFIKKQVILIFIKVEFKFTMANFIAFNTLLINYAEDSCLLINITNQKQVKVKIIFIIVFIIKTKANYFTRFNICCLD